MDEETHDTTQFPSMQIGTFHVPEVDDRSHVFEVMPVNDHERRTYAMISSSRSRASRVLLLALFVK